MPLGGMLFLISVFSIHLILLFFSTSIFAQAIDTDSTNHGLLLKVESILYNVEIKDFILNLDIYPSGLTLSRNTDVAANIALVLNKTVNGNERDIVYLWSTKLLYKE
jgi:hypothetical protein